MKKVSFVLGLLLFFSTQAQSATFRDMFYEDAPAHECFEAAEKGILHKVEGLSIFYAIYNSRYYFFRTSADTNFVCAYMKER
jgi:hypothetical protein